MSKHYRITSGDKLGAVKKKTTGSGVVNRPSGLGLHVSPSGVSTQSTQSTKTNGSVLSQQSKISSLQQDLFAKLDKATNKLPDQDNEDGLDSLDRLEMLGVGLGTQEEHDRYEYLANRGKTHVNTRAGDDFEMKKQQYRAKEQDKKKQEKRTHKRKLLTQIPKDDEKVMLTAAGIEQIEAEDDDDDQDEPFDPEELRDGVNGLYEFEDKEMMDLMNECLDEVKRDCLKYHRVGLGFHSREKRMIWQRSEGSSRRLMPRKTSTNKPTAILARN